MIDNRDISVTRLDTGDIAYIRYEQTDDYPRLADRLRATAYNQAKYLADTIDETLRKTIILLDNARAGLTDEEEALLNKIVDTTLEAQRASYKTLDALWEWNQVAGRKALNERIAQQTQQTQQSNEQASTRDHNGRD